MEPASAPTTKAGRHPAGRFLVVVALLLALVLVALPGCSLLTGRNDSGAGDSQAGAPGGSGGDGGTGSGSPTSSATDGIDPASVEDPVIRAWIEACRRVAGVHLASFDGENTYVLAAFGRRPTDGYQVSPTETTTDGEQSFVFKLVSPNGAANDVITYPVGISRVFGPPEKIASAQALDEDGRPLPEVTGPANAFIVPTAPLPGDSVSGTTLHLAGYARVFEAQLSYSLEDGHNVLASGSVTADKGAPEWGRFELDVTFAQPTSPGLTLVLFDESPKDGSVVYEAVIPLEWADR